MHVRNAPETFRLAMARHPEYDDRFWRYVEGLPASVTVLDQNLWQVSAPGGEATLRYLIRLPVSGPSARAAWRPFLTPTGGLIGDLHTFLYMVDEPQAPSHVMLRLPAGWSVATALAPTGDPHIFFAASAAVLAESPILVGQLRDWRFVVNDTPYRVSYWPLPDGNAFDAAAFVAGIEKLVREAVALFGAAPWREYSFLLRDGAYGALEHSDSLTLGAPSATLAGNPYALHEEIAHEFVHAWNLMRIHPAEYRGIDYRPAPPSAGLWFSEGLSMFYADLLLRRAGLPTETPTRVAHLEELIARYLAEPGNARFSAEQVSRAANDTRPGALGDYSASTHLQGELLGAMLDLIIRDATANQRSMDDVMRAMLDRFSGTRGFTGKDIENTVAGLCGCGVTSFFDAYVRGAAPIEFNRYLDLAGLRMEAVWEKTDTPDLGAWAWMEPDENTLRIAIADPASVWGRAGLHTGDQILADEWSHIRQRRRVPRHAQAAACGRHRCARSEAWWRHPDRDGDHYVTGPPKGQDQRTASPDGAPARGSRSLALIALCRFGIVRLLSTSRICAVWRAECAASKSRNWYASMGPAGPGPTWTRSSSVVVVTYAMVLSRRAVNSRAASSGVANLPEGTMASGALALWLRSCTPATILRSTSSVDWAGRSTAGVLSTCWAPPKIKFSARIMCSAHSCTDHTSGAGLKVHCAALSPWMLASIAFLEVSSCSSKYARSAGVILPSAAKIGATAHSKSGNIFVIVVLLFPLG